MFLEALAHVTDRNTPAFKETLMEMLERYPDTDLSPYASSYLKGLAQGRTLAEGAGSNMRGMLWDIRLSNDSTATGSETPLEFEVEADTEQYLVLLYPTDVISQNALLYAIARHNFSAFVVKDFDLEQMNFGRLGILIIKGFKNLGELNHYRRVMADSEELTLPSDVRPVVISAKNFDTLLKSGRSFDEYFRFMENKTYRDTEESVLPPEFFGPSEGLPAEEESTDGAPEAQAPSASPSLSEEESPASEPSTSASPFPSEEEAPAPSSSEEETPEETPPPAV